MLFNEGWKYCVGNLMPQDETDGWGGAKSHAYKFGATARKLDDSEWGNVELPHDFVLSDNYTKEYKVDESINAIPSMEAIDNRHFAGGSLKGGVCWYRKSFRLEEIGIRSCANCRVFLSFEGIYRNATIYINEYYVGHHKNGYSSFRFDISDFLLEGEKNVIAIRVDSRGREGWWYEGGGIYRNVWLDVYPLVYIEPASIYVYADDVDVKSKTADLYWSADVRNHSIKRMDAFVTVRCKTPKGSELILYEGKCSLNGWQKLTIGNKYQIDGATLWDLDNPALYTLSISIQCDGENTETQTRFGIRKLKFDANNGFFLNDRPVKIKGVCCHQDHAGVGIAVPKEVWRFRIAQLKRMGANAYRSAHHQASQEVLDICDELGMLVLDETRRMSAAEDDLVEIREMVKSGRNHPSIFMWGIGNEEIFSQDRPETARATMTMKMAIRELDASRPVTSAVVCWNGDEHFQTAERYISVTRNLDVMGFNYSKTAWDDYHERMPAQPIIITEASTNSWTRGCYNTNEHMASYYTYDDSNLEKCSNKRKAVRMNIGEEEWDHVAVRDYIIGAFVWTGFDYRGEPTPMPYPSILSQFGIFDYCGFEKDNFYYYRSIWQEKPVLHVFPHWNHETEGMKFPVFVYTNLEEVELLVNGVCFGKKRVKPNWYVRFDDIMYTPGNITVIGYTQGMEILRSTVCTSGAQDKIQMEIMNEKPLSSGCIAIVKVRVVDEAGNTVPTANALLEFKTDGGRIIGCGNGDPGDHTSDCIPGRHVFHGLAEVLVKLPSNGERVTLTAQAEGLKPCCINLNPIQIQEDM